jgi:non-ribosomal peptide synthetase component E (peptide arylation enzyme)
MGGALNMAHSSTAKKAALKTLIVAGGSALVFTDKLNIAALQAVKGPSQTVTALVPHIYTVWYFSSSLYEAPLVLLGF